MKRQKRQRIFMSVMAGFLALLMLLPILANILMR
jgi:predicted nucleic acid-binding Zn ribbon protein